MIKKSVKCDQGVVETLPMDEIFSPYCVLFGNNTQLQFPSIVIVLERIHFGEFKYPFYFGEFKYPFLFVEVLLPFEVMVCLPHSLVLVLKRYVSIQSEICYLVTELNQDVEERSIRKKTRHCWPTMILYQVFEHAHNSLAS